MVLELASFDQDWATIMKEHGRIRDFPAGASIILQGDELKSIGIIISGVASARVNSENGDETWVDQFNPEDFFGHISLLTQSPIDFELRANTDIRVLIIPAQKFQQLLISDTVLSVGLAQDLALRLKTMMHRLIEALTLSSTGRVCAELIRLAEPVGIDPDRLIIRPKPVFVDIAFRINSTRETVSRTVSRLQRSGIVSREPGSLLIHKPDALKNHMR